MIILTQKTKNLYLLILKNTWGYSRVKLMGMIEVFSRGFVFSILFWGRKIWHVIFWGP